MQASNAWATNAKCKVNSEIQQANNLAYLKIREHKFKKFREHNLGKGLVIASKCDGPATYQKCKVINLYTSKIALMFYVCEGNLSPTRKPCTFLFTSIQPHPGIFFILLSFIIFHTFSMHCSKSMQGPQGIRHKSGNPATHRTMNE
jgi:hypothetical protein